MDRSVFESTYSMFNGITWYIQAVMNCMYAHRSATMDDLLPTVEWLVRNKAYYSGTLLDSLPRGSVRLLRAIAAQGRVREPTSSAFMAAHGLRASASVRISLAKLLGLGLLSRDDDGSYVVDDRLFAIWLASPQ